jgi:hypothetical protein
MKSYQWQLVHTFTLPTDSKGQNLWRVDFDANYHSDLAELRKKYSEYLHETRGEIHEQIEFWVLLPPPETTPETTPETNNIKPINFKQLQDKERFKGELDMLHETIEIMLRDDNLESYPELNNALQDVHSLIEALDIQIDYYNC